MRYLIKINIYLEFIEHIYLDILYYRIYDIKFLKIKVIIYVQ